MDNSKYPFTSEEQQNVTKNIKNLVQPILKRADSQGPIINLQWLYDILFNKVE